MRLSGTVVSIGAMQILDKLERTMASPDFVQQLERTQKCAHTEDGTDELDELLGDYVVVTKDDVVNAMASYIAAWLSNLPEAKNMAPEELQSAVLGGVRVRVFFSMFCT